MRKEIEGNSIKVIIIFEESEKEFVDKLTKIVEDEILDKEKAYKITHPCGMEEFGFSLK
ncbi:hypothetical protein L6307_02870 [Candidatus Parcubacteria bacterium]|nr:hypothetical protein [Candidatus Parcubacteria bacterium]